MGNIRVGWVMGCLAAIPFVAQAEEAWETIATGPIVIKARSRPGSPIREVWAEGEMNADVRDVQAVVLDAEAYPRFMPYVKESRYIGKPSPDGSCITYSRVEPPIVSARDFVLKTTIVKRVDEDGHGVFINKWEALPDQLPVRANIVRLRTNEGSWDVRPKGNGRSHVIYRFAVDPGGWVPAFAVNLGHKTGVMDTFRAIEREAQRRSAERNKQASSP